MFLGPPCLAMSCCIAVEARAERPDPSTGVPCHWNVHPPWPSTARTSSRWRSAACARALLEAWRGAALEGGEALPPLSPPPHAMSNVVARMPAICDARLFIGRPPILAALIMRDHLVSG